MCVICAPLSTCATCTFCTVAHNPNTKYMSCTTHTEYLRRLTQFTCTAHQWGPQYLCQQSINFSIIKFNYTETMNWYEINVKSKAFNFHFTFGYVQYYVRNVCIAANSQCQSKFYLDVDDFRNNFDNVDCQIPLGWSGQMGTLPNIQNMLMSRIMVMLNEIPNIWLFI